MNEINVIPVDHATFVLTIGDITIYVDPVGGAEAFDRFPEPDFILVTDIHHDHLEPETVNAVKYDNTIVIGPEAVLNGLKYGELLNNGDSKTFGKIQIEATPMYNLTEERMMYHPKGRGNGYLITANNERIYISGDTEDIPEMRELKDIDYALVCMNLPYTMTVEQAASAVLEFKPKVVIPYHFRGKDEVSDVDRFRHLVSQNKDIEVRILDWYGN